MLRNMKLNVFVTVVIVLAGTLLVMGNGLVYYHVEKIDHDAQLAMSSIITSDVSSPSYGQTTRKYEGLLADRVQRVKIFLLVFTVIGLLCVAGIGIAICRGVTRPLKEALTSAEKIAAGDLSEMIVSKGKSEPALLLKAFSHMSQSLSMIINRLKQSSETLVVSSASASQIAENIKSSAEVSSNKAHRVSESTKKMTEGTIEMAAAVEEASSKMLIVTTAAEDMGRSLEDIVTQSMTAKEKTEKSVSDSESVSSGMHILSDAAHEIGAVTETINDISSQTNLLALNATIEAARAGEAGKGFAVVASEIKALADQSSSATKEIRQKIERIQQSANNAVADIGTITRIVTEVNELVLSISEAISKQSAVTSNIVTSVEDASTIMREVAEQISQVTTSTRELSSSIDEVSFYAEQAHHDGLESGTVADNLIGISTEISGMIGVFSLNEAYNQDGISMTGELRKISEKKKEKERLMAQQKKRADEEKNSIMVWSDDFLVGIKEVDDQHKTLVDSLNELYRAIKSNTAHEALDRILEKLVGYTDFHFKTEERLFETYDYPDKDSHRATHDALREQAVTYAGEFKEGKMIGSQLLKFLKDWLGNHILKADMAYAPYLIKKMNPTASDGLKGASPSTQQKGHPS